MKFMKLGTRLDTFFTADGVRSVCTEVSTDLMVQVEECRYLLHKFPLLSKCARLQRLCAEAAAADCRDQVGVVVLPDFPGGAEAFELCAKFCYGVAVTFSAHNIVPARCAAEYLQMTDDLDKGNLVGKLEAFLNSCILRRWRDTLVALQATRPLPRWSEELGITARCVDAVSSLILSTPPSKATWSMQGSHKSSSLSMSSRGWWAEDIAELSVDLYWRVMISVKSAAAVAAAAGNTSDKLIGKALKVYAYRWLPNLSRDYRSRRYDLSEASAASGAQGATSKHRLLLEKIVALLPAGKGSVSCSFLLKLLKFANVLGAAASTKMELARRAGMQLEEATMRDLLIPSLSDEAQALYDVDVVMAILEEFLLQARSPPTTPPRGKFRCERRRSRSAENLEAMGQDSGGGRRSSSSASHGSKLRVAKLIDGYLQEIASDANLPLGKLVALAEAVPEFARTDHDDLYRVVDTYLKAHPDLDKSERKRLCRILDCRKLSVEACMHAAQNELLPLRVVVQVLFFDQARAAASGARLPELPGNIKAILAAAAAAAAATAPDENESSKPVVHLGVAAPPVDAWSISSVAKSQKHKVATLRMKLEEADNDADLEEEAEAGFPRPGGLERTTSSRFKSLCAIPNRPGRIFGKFWTMSRSSSERR